jgi:hypothetical protein
MAVEQYEHADEVTHLADLYSLAIMIWELVTGRLPWQHPDHAVLYFQQRTVIPDRPPADVMPPEWAEVLLAGLSVDPAARPRSARELATALASALPAVGRVPSGAEILAGLAPHFVRKAAPGDETVRNASDVDRIGPLLWPARETAPDAPRERPRPNVPAARDAAEAPVMQRTTLSAATGVTSRPAERRHARWKLALAALGTTAVAALATGGIVARVSGAAPSAPAGAVADRERDPAPAIDRSRVAADGSATEPARSRAPSDTPAMEARAGHLDGSQGARADVKAPAPIVPPARANPGAPAAPVLPSSRRSSGISSAAQPAGNARSGAPRPDRTTTFDPDDVSGPEE